MDHPERAPHRERNLDISEYSESTQVGVKSLQASMRDVAENLSQFRIDEDGSPDLALSNVEEMKSFKGTKKVFQETQMKNLEGSTEESQAS